MIHRMIGGLLTFVGVFCLICTLPMYEAKSGAKRRECKQALKGSDYTGTKSTTWTGGTCQHWTSQVPHEHNYTSASKFPDVRLEDAGNYCRNPVGPWDYLAPWCYTTDPDVRWQYCHIPLCSAFPECKLTEEGTEYRGYKMVTSSGRHCDQTSAGIAEANYCRNPDGRKTGPYCMVKDGENHTAEPCVIPFCKPVMHCRRTVNGSEYSGPISVTVHGRTCQRWSDQYPHQHPYTDPALFPDRNLEDAENYCRNPDNSADGPWCFTQDPLKRREKCNIEICQDCRISSNGREYSGGLTQVFTGETCDKWNIIDMDKLWKDQSRYPDVSVEASQNYCRNPDNDPRGPWCFVKGIKKYCDIPLCSGSTKNRINPPRAKHVIHIGIDGLRPDCISGADGGAPNMLKRMAEDGTHTLTRATTGLFTVSGPGWSTTLCGMNSELTGITSNSWLPPWHGSKMPIMPASGNNQPLPCIFHELKSQDPSIRTGIFFIWEWLKHMANQGYPGDIDMELFCPIPYVICEDYLVMNLISYLKQLYISAEKSYTFLYLVSVDETGHEYGWCGKEYNTSVGIADQQIGKILDYIKEANKEDDTLVIVNADHGGLGTDHGRQIDEDVHIPMFIKGPGVKKGYDFQIDVRNEDIVPTIAEVLGLKPNPYWTGRIIEDAFIDD